MTKLKKKIIIKGSIRTLTGIHIGSSYSALGIGGPDKVVIRSPLHENRPIIPGSSLKGKMRSLLELNHGTLGKNNKGHGPTMDLNHAAARLFGNAPASSSEKQQASRLVVRDGVLLNDGDEYANTELPFSETKTEVSIDRITAKANPRTFERVPAGSNFELNMILSIFEGDDEEELKSNLKEAMQLVKDDYLGGQGSRGYGQVDFEIEKVVERSNKYYSGEENEKDITEQFQFINK